MPIYGRDIDGEAPGMTVRAVIVVIGADGEGADGVTIVNQMHEDLHHSLVDMHQLAASTAHGVPFGGGLNVAQVTGIIGLIPALFMKLEQLPGVRRGIPRHQSRHRVPDGRAVVQSRIVRREVGCDQGMRMPAVLAINRDASLGLSVAQRRDERLAGPVAHPDGRVTFDVYAPKCVLYGENV